TGRERARGRAWRAAAARPLLAVQRCLESAVQVARNVVEQERSLPWGEAAFDSGAELLARAAVGLETREVEAHVVVIEVGRARSRGAVCVIATRVVDECSCVVHATAGAVVPHDRRRREAPGAGKGDRVAFV